MKATMHIDFIVPCNCHSFPRGSDFTWGFTYPGLEPNTMLYLATEASAELGLAPSSMHIGVQCRKCKTKITVPLSSLIASVCPISSKV